MNLNKLSLLALTVASALTVAAGSVAAKPATVQGSPKDPGVVNKERILYWAEKRGELASNASPQAKAAYLKQYLANVKPVNHLSGPMAKAFEKARSSKAAKAQRASKDFDTKTVKVLTVLVDFPDLPHDENRLTAQDTAMFYSDYNVAHYRDLMFSTTGYTGPSGQNLISGYQYYQAESGQSLNFTGDVFDWVTADNSAASYGGNSGSAGDDQNVPNLIKEAVAKTIAANPGINLSEYDQEDQNDLDSDGNLNEPDGMIDHVMVFHSSVGEEAGGGVIGANAIWSHRWSVGAPYTIPGTSYKLYGYTIQPIDAAAGVAVHEFGHDLGLPDEYDTANSDIGEPVSMWSVMSGGSWAGSIPGTEPVGFSAYARDKFQEWYGGNWINQTILDLPTLQAGQQTIDLVAAVNHDGGVNQVRIDLPGAMSTPFAGSGLYYSTHVDEQNRRLSFSTTVPSSANARLQFQAQWKIEQDYDYARVLVNGTAIAGSSTVAGVNPEHAGIQHYLTGNSAAGWTLQTFSLAAYEGQNVTITVEYVTDQAVGGYGLMIDNLTVNDGVSNSFSADAESDGLVTLTGFTRVAQVETTARSNYFIQLRNHSGIDESLDLENYDHGVLMWFADPNYDDNNVANHPGHGFLGVIDADQVLATKNNGDALNSDQQIRDAAFRRMNQRSKTNDNHLPAIFSFDDRYDYSSPGSPQSGMVLPVNKLVMSVLEQANDSSTARIRVGADPASTALTASIARTISGLTVNFTGTAAGGSGALTYLWNFGDNGTSTVLSPSHSFARAGSYTVSLTVTDANNVSRTTSSVVTVSGSSGGSSSGGGGGGGGSFAIGALLLLAGARQWRSKR